MHRLRLTRHVPSGLKNAHNPFRTFIVIISLVKRINVPPHRPNYNAQPRPSPDLRQRPFRRANISVGFHPHAPKIAISISTNPFCISPPIGGVQVHSTLFFLHHHAIDETNCQSIVTTYISRLLFALLILAHTFTTPFRLSYFRIEYINYQIIKSRLNVCHAFSFLCMLVYFF